MQVEISLRNKHKLPYLLELLRSLDFVESVNVQPDVSTNLPTVTSLFDRFYGKAQTGQSIEQLDEKLSDLRNEWTRNF